MVNSGDTAWLLIATAMVMLMTPALALFYGGMVQSKNVLSTFMHSFFALGLVTVQWALLGYSLAFGRSHGGLIGGLDLAAMHGVGMEAKAGTAVPHLLYFMYQGMFAVITPALISGAFAERMRFPAYCLLTLVWSTLVYDPIAHWVWNDDGWLHKMGALDFAGGTVVHLASGVSALVTALVLGRRVGHPQAPHNLTMTVTGAGLLWFGWFGFNAGSSLAANGTGALAFANTHLAAAAGALAWGLIEQQRIGKVTMLGVASGLVAGLVGITPAAGYVGPLGALAIGAIAGVACYGGVLLKARFRYDDALDAFGVHGVGGAAGAILTGVFAQAAWNKDGADGLIAGKLGLLGVQLLGIAAAAAWAAFATFVILKVIQATVGLRVEPDAEREGLDSVLHGESGYSFGSGGNPHEQ